MNSASNIRTSFRVLASAAFVFAAAGSGCDHAPGVFDEPHEEVDSISISGEYHGGQYEMEAEPTYEQATESRDRHTDFGENMRIDSVEERRSTFSVDVNTASYTMMRSALNSGHLPTSTSVRTEEFINFFDYNYSAPQDAPFAINMEMAPSYFGSDDDAERHLMQIGVRARDVSIENMKPNNLVFLVDTSGSMRPSSRLPLAKQSLHILLEYLRPTDTVAIQTYASGSETVLEPTPVSDFRTIERAILELEAEGGTNGEGGIRDAYNLAEESFVEDGNNRVIVMTDGDFNIGKRGDDVVEMVKGYREREIALTSVGFGRGNHNDAVMERLARQGSGNYFYIDNQEEAQRIFGTDLPSTLEIVASDVRIQVEFNEDAVKNYRLVGYEKRVLDNEDFEKESTNAAEVGPGHDVTAFYEVELHDGARQDADSVAGVRVRYKERLLGNSLEVREEMEMAQIRDNFREASAPFRFAAAVAEFAATLRGSEYAQGERFGEIHSVAANARFGNVDEQAEFLQLVETAQSLEQ